MTKQTKQVELAQWKDRFDKLWRRISNTIKTNHENRKIWLPDPCDEEGDYSYVDETLKRFIKVVLAQAQQEAYERGQRETYEEILAFQSAYVYDKYSCLGQKDDELNAEFFSKLNKWLDEQIKALQQEQE